MRILGEILRLSGIEEKDNDSLHLRTEGQPMLGEFAWSPGKITEREEK